MDSKRGWSAFISIILSVSVACEARMKFSITNTWDNKPADHGSIDIELYPEGDSVIMEIKSPFFNDPPAPEGEVGKPFTKLWDYEVVEAFFLGAEEKYLEVEFSPHGQHLLLLLNGRKNAIKMCLPVEYRSTVDDGKWTGVAKIPKSYFPPKVTRFNAYAIHGSGENRIYEALFPVPTGHFPHADFHRLEFFRYVDLEKFLNLEKSLSGVWLNAIQEAADGKELSCDN